MPTPADGIGVRARVEGVAPEMIDDERKTVTALFADIKGSMELMESLDPEEARAVVDPALKLMMDAVHRYDGYIVQSTGDGIFALFGAPIAHEDHPQRALYAAIRMQEELSRYSHQLRSQGRLPLQARAGLNTGEVVVRSLETGAGHTEYTSIGHSTSLGARMQPLAPVGSIAATDTTRKLCEGYFTFKSLGPTLVKGVSEPIEVYEVTGLGPLRTRLQRAATRGLTKFVGREREMEALRYALEQSKTGHGQIVAAIAEPGVGKSRLFYEFKAVSQSGCMVLETFSVSHGKASAYLPVIDLLHGYFEIIPEDGERKRREKIAGKIAILDRTLENTLPYLFGLLGIVEGEDPLAQMDGQVKKRRTLEAIKRMVLRESLNQPLIVIFEDLHWIDGETQALLNLLADGIANARVLLMVNYRPEYNHEWGNRTYYTQLRLDPLRKENADEMLSALLGDAVELVPLKRTIVERTEGNPFFIEELVQALFEEGVLMRNGGIKVARSISQLRIPPTAQGVLAARIDRLPADQKELLHTLAVMGREFPLGLIRRVVQRSDPGLDHLLEELQLAEFIYEQPAVGDVEYIFKHALTQEVAYNSILSDRRKLFHERTGQALESMFAANLDDHLSELAHHYSRSDNAAEAVEYLGRAGQQALRRSAYPDAISSLMAAIDLLQRLPESRERIQQELLLQLSVGPALMATKGFSAQEVERAYSRARALCERAGDPSMLSRALYGLWVVYFVRPELRTAYELGGELLRRAESTRDSVLLLYAQVALGLTLYQMSEFLPARDYLEVGIRLYDREHHHPFVFRYGGTDAGVLCRSFIAFTLWSLGHPERALERANEATALAQQLSDDPQSLVAAECFKGILCQLRGEPLAVQETAERVIAICTEHGFSFWLAQATILRGWAIAVLGRNSGGIKQIREGLARARETGGEWQRTGSLCLLAEACAELGLFEEGLIALEEALAAMDEHQERNAEAVVHRLKGELLLKQNSSNLADARMCFHRAIDVSRKQGTISLELRATTSLARLLSKQGRYDEARAMLADIYRRFTEGFDTADLKEAKALLEELGGTEHGPRT